MDDLKKLEQEKAELNALINNGMPFEIVDTGFQRKKGFWGLIGKRVPVQVRKQFEIKQFTLGTLDRLSAEWIEFAIDEVKLKSEDATKHAKELVRKHTKRCAKIVALAVMGTNYLIPKCSINGVVRYVENTKQLGYLTDLFFRTIKPSDLFQLCVLIDSMSNLGDFINSIRLMSNGRSTMPIRIEANKED